MSKSVAIAAKGNLAEAIKQVLQPAMANTEFRVVDKVTDKKDEEIVASLGIPSYIPNRAITKVVAVGSKMDKDATPASRKAQWDVLRNEESTVQEIVAELGYPNSYTIIPGPILNEMKIAFGDIMMEAGDAADDAEKAAAYKKAFDIVKTILA